MKGTRPLDLVSACFTGTFEVRNRGLFMLGVSTGGRISELLGLQIGDVWRNGSAVTDLLYEKSIVKGGEVSRAVPVNVDGRRLRILLFGTVSDMECISRVRCFRRGSGIIESQQIIFGLEEIKCQTYL